MATHDKHATISGTKYNLKRMSMYGLGKESAVITGELAKEFPLVVQTLSGISSGLAEYPVGIVTMGLAGAVSAALTQMDYKQKRNDTKQLYSEELAVKLGKKVEAVTEKDMDALASGDASKGIEGNKTIGEHLAKTTRQRNWGIVFSVAATLASLGVVQFGLDHAAMAAFGHVGEIALKGLAGVLTYNVVKQPLHWLGDKLFRLEEHTAHDHIVSIKRDHDNCKHITREQVAAVYASARPEVDHFIETQFGAHYDDLPIAAKKSATEHLSQYLPIDELRDKINHGVYNATELAFSVQGDMSGVEHAPTRVEPKKPGIMGAMLHKIRHAVSHKPQQVQEAVVTQAPDTQVAAAVAVTYHNEAPTHSFVKQLGLNPIEAGMSQLDRLQQRGRGGADITPP